MRCQSVKKMMVIALVLFLVSSTFTLFFVTAGSPRTVLNSGTESFPYPGDDWAWSMIGTQYAHQRGEYGDDVVVAVLDTGIDYTHPDLKDKMWSDIGYDFVNDDDDPMDEDGHGTHVAGIISSVAPGAKLMALKVLEEEGGSWMDVSKAIRYARENGADIISMSFGGQYNAFTPAFELQMERAYEMDDILLVGAAGNDNSSEKFYPAGYDSVVSVSAVDSSKEKAYYSNHGSWIEIAAPGGGTQKQVYSTLPNGSYGNKIGTSMACPFVTGVAALRRSFKTGETNKEVRSVLQNTADDIGDENYYGHGLVNAYRASGGEVPTPVQDLNAETDDSLVELSWEEPWGEGLSSLKGYRIYRGKDQDEMELKKELDRNLTSYEDTGVENNLTYYYSVTAFNDQGESLEGTIREATPRAEPVVPSSPKDVTAEVLDEGVEVTWNKPSDDGGSSITSYKIYRQRSEDELKLLSEVEAGTSKHLDKNVDPGTDYTYAVTAINEVGKSERSYTDTVTVPEDHSPEPVRPSSPREVTAEVLDEGVELIWDQPLDDGGSPITTYKIYKAKDGGELEYLVEVENGTMSYLDKEVEGGSNYTYAVTAVNEVGESERNNAETTTVTLSEDYEPVPSDEEDGGWLEQINESDIPLIPILIVLVALISLVIIAVALRKRR